MIKMPREDGAWYMALTCGLCGWAAARRFAWEPFVLAAAALSLFAGAQAIRSARRLWDVDPKAARRSAAVFALSGLAPIAAFAIFVARHLDPDWIVALMLPAFFYAPVILIGAERRPWARVLAVAALTALAPATYALASGTFGPVAAILWAALAGYYLLGATFIMARLRRSTPALWTVRIATPLVAAAAFACSAHGGAHWILALAFLVLAARTWTFRFADRPVDPRRVGKVELAFSSVAAALVLAAIWLR